MCDIRNLLAMLGHPKTFNLWLASGPIALGLFVAGLLGAMWLPAELARVAVWLALVPAVAIIAAIVFAVVASIMG